MKTACYVNRRTGEVLSNREFPVKGPRLIRPVMRPTQALAPVTETGEYEVELFDAIRIAWND